MCKFFQPRLQYDERLVYLQHYSWGRRDWWIGAFGSNRPFWIIMAVNLTNKKDFAPHPLSTNQLLFRFYSQWMASDNKYAGLFRAFLQLPSSQVSEIHCCVLTHTFWIFISTTSYSVLYPSESIFPLLGFYCCVMQRKDKWKLFALTDLIFW